MKKEKRGWIRIVESIMAILLIAAVVLIAIRYSQTGSSDISSNVYETESAMINQVQVNQTLRNEIVGIPALTLPILWSQFVSVAPNTENEINQTTPSYLECQGQICSTSDSCLLKNPPDKTVYSESVLITANLTEYNPKVLKIFCWQP